MPLKSQTKNELDGYFLMAKELPYFRFTVQEWQNGNIGLERYELRGLFIEICAYYWIKDCSITLAMLKKRFSNVINLIKELLKLEIITLDKNDEFIKIQFLNEQFDLLSERRHRRQIAGAKGGKKKSSNAKAKLKQSSSYKDKDKDKDKIKHKHGDYKNVLLKDSELEKLKAKFPNWKFRIKNLDEYIETSGKTYKNHYLVILKWSEKEPIKEKKVVSIEYICPNKHLETFKDDIVIFHTCKICNETMELSRKIRK